MTFHFFLPSDFVYCLSAKVWWNALRQNNNYRTMMQAREAQQVYPSILWHYSIRYQRKGGSENLFPFIYIWYSAKPERMSLVFSYTSANLLSQRIAYPSIAFGLSKTQRIYFHSTPTIQRKMRLNLIDWSNFKSK